MHRFPDHCISCHRILSTSYSEGQHTYIYVFIWRATRTLSDDEAGSDDNRLQYIDLKNFFCSNRPFITPRKLQFDVFRNGICRINSQCRGLHKPSHLSNITWRSPCSGLRSRVGSHGTQVRTFPGGRRAGSRPGKPVLVHDTGWCEGRLRRLSGIHSRTTCRCFRKTARRRALSAVLRHRHAMHCRACRQVLTVQ